MTAPHHPDTTPDDSVTFARRDTTPENTAPVTVWWLDDRDTDDDSDPSHTGDRDSDSAPPQTAAAFMSRLSRRLVLTYTRRGDVIIDLDGDDYLRAAAARSARDYLALTNPGTVADLDQLHPVSMVALRWPRTNGPTPTASISDLFLACQLMMNADMSVLAVTSTFANDTITPARLEMLLPAASAAGFRHTLAIVALTCPDGGDRYLFYATTDEASAAIATSRHDTSRPAIMVDLFTPDTNPSRDA